MIFNILSEYQPLKEVIIGSTVNFTEGEKINKAMKTYYGTEFSPKKTEIIKEYLFLEKILTTHKVKVYKPQPSKQIPQQLAPRDIGFVIKDTFIMSNMKWQSRKKEISSIRPMLKQYKGKVIKTPSNVYLEGGNIVIDKKLIFIGIGLRTSKNAISFLQEKFKFFQVIPIFLNNKEEIIHLDAVFNIISSNSAIIYPQGLKNIPKQIKSYKLIRVSKEEKNNGACNVLSINPKDLIIRNKLPSLKNTLTKMGFNCYETIWNETKKTGTVGPRCATLPLARQN